MGRGWWAEALELVLPHTCPGCGAAESWCARCDATLRPPRSVRLPSATLDRVRGPLLPVRSMARWHGPVRDAVIAGKERGRRDLPVLLGRRLADGLQVLSRWDPPPGPLWLVPAPGRPGAARRRGGDPVTVMARSAAAELAARGRPVGVGRVLVTARSARDSVGLDAAGRWANLQGRIRFRPGAGPPPGAAVVLVDDVVTSGTTLVLAADVLRCARRDVEVWCGLTLASAAPWLSP